MRYWKFGVWKFREIVLCQDSDWLITCLSNHSIHAMFDFSTNLTTKSKFFFHPSDLLFCVMSKFSRTFWSNQIFIKSFKIEKILKGTLDLIPSPSLSVKIQIMGRKVWNVVKAKHCWVLPTNFLFSKVCWQYPVMFCLHTSSKLSRP